MSCPQLIRIAAAASLVCALSQSATAGEVKGNCRYEGKESLLVDGVFYRAPNAFDKAKMERTLIFTTVALDKVAIGRATDIEDAVREQVWAGEGEGRIQLSIDAEGSVWAMNYASSGTSLSQSGTGVGELKLTADGADTIAGTFSVGEKEDELNCSITFDLGSGEANAAVAAAPPLPKGKPIPAGGGELGKVYLQSYEAMKKGDIDALIATAVEEIRGQMEASRKDPEFPKMMALMQAFAPASLSVTGGQDFGDSAELVLEGEDENGGKVAGTAQMKKEGGVWKVGKTSMKSSISN